LILSVQRACQGCGHGKKAGLWRGVVGKVVARYLDFGIFDRGFARVRCKDCTA
jgi:hypothetical protein